MAVHPTHTLTLLAVLGTASTTTLAAQVCPNGEISVLEVSPHPIFATDLSTDGGAFPWFYGIANWIHADTNEGLIRDELLFRVGDCYDLLLATESVRLLRQLGFIDRAEASAERQPDGSVHVIVETWDRWTLNVSVRIRLEEGFEFNGVDVTERNLFGRGITLGAFYRDDQERLAIGGNLATTRFLGTRWNANLQAAQTRPGSSFQQSFFYPFVGEVGRVAALESFIDQEDLFAYNVQGEAFPGGETYTHVVHPFGQRSVEISAAKRFGRPGRLTILGGGLSTEEWRYLGLGNGAEVVQNRDFGNAAPAPPEVTAILLPQLRPYSATRLNVLLAQRNLSYQERDRLDALMGVQDIPVGGEVAVVLGKSIPILGSSRVDQDSDWFGRVRFYGGLAPGRWVLASTASIEGRQILDDAEDGWKDVLGEFDVYTYWRPTENSRHTLFARVSGAAGWSMTGPFQLTLGGTGALRGYSRDDLPGGRRVIASLEDRIYFGSPWGGFMDLGMTAFVDVGSMWAGDVPFGRDSGLLATGGAGLRIGIPSGTRGVTRIDIAFPLNGADAFSKPTFRITRSEQLGLRRGTEDRQIRRSRRTGVGQGILPDPSQGR